MGTCISNRRVMRVVLAVALAVAAGCSDEEIVNPGITPDSTPPIAIENLSATNVSSTSITISWTSPGDDGSLGTAAKYDIRYSTEPIGDSNWSATIPLNNEPSPQAAGSTESLLVSNLIAGTAYYFAMKTADEAMNWSAISTSPSATPAPHEWLWSPLGSGVSGTVNALTVYDGKLIAGGSFSVAGGVAASNIAAWDGSTWSALGAGTNDGVLALTVYDGKLIAAGHFSRAGETSSSRIAAWDGAEWSSLGAGLQGQYFAWATVLGVFKGSLIVGGMFEMAGGIKASNIASWNGKTWHSLGNGECEGVETMEPFALCSYRGQLIVGGRFYLAGGIHSGPLAQWSGMSWSKSACPTNGWHHRDVVYALLTHDEKLMVGGRIETFDISGWRTLVGGNVALWSDGKWLALGDGLRTYSYGYGSKVRCAVSYNTMIIAGGFEDAGECHAHGIAVWNGATWLPMTDELDGAETIATMTIYNGTIVVAGEFELERTGACNIAACVEQ
jgi:hypothetical protein